MRAILENIRSGEVSGHEVPQPELRPGGVLVRTAFSAISAGTELAHREQVEKSLLGKALARPDLVRQVVDFARTAGVKAAYQKVQSRLDTLAPLGYSCAGVVIAAGQGVSEFQPGDRVACAGAGYASHCEVNFIPKNLAVRVPDAVTLEAASLSAIGAIALQGFRQSQAVLGEVVAVIGAGLVGVLTIQLAKAAGCRVIAIDRDSQRVESARQFGADLALNSTDRNTPQRVQEFARYGADVAIITAATPSAEPVELAADICRDRGRIVVVGTVDLGVSRKTMYMKELSLVLSRSYGPGRYDSQYEEDGVDYSASLFNTSSMTESAHKHKKLNKRMIRKAQKREEAELAEQERVDHILAKVSAHGMHSLTWWEKRSLRKATDRQRRRDLDLKEEMTRKGF